MAKSNRLFSKGRRSGSYDRVAPTREMLERILIVCEGSKTEPYYFSSFLKDHRISTADVKIYGKECGSDPRTVVEFACAEYKKDSDFDAVFCVFDRDTHVTFHEAKDILVQRNIDGAILRGVISIPCFELWYILHFVARTEPFSARGKKSIGQCVVDELKRHIPGYGKGKQDFYAVLKDRFEQARKNAKLVRREMQKVQSRNPWTEIDELLEYILSKCK